MRVTFLSRSWFFCGLLILALASPIWGQSQTPTPPLTPQQSVPTGPIDARGQDARAQQRQANEAHARLQENMRRARIMNSRKPGTVLPLVTTEDDLTPAERKALLPAPEDLTTYAEFLRQPDTGIFRLLRVTAGAGKVMRAGDAASSMPVFLVGGGAHYSFTKRNHNADKWSDLCWEKDEFVVGVAGESLSLLVELGEARLEDLTTESRGVDYLARLVPPEQAREAEQLFTQLDSGVTANGFGYHLSLPWKLNTTYALRSVNYGRSDLLVAFRAVRQDANESLIVLWKKLKSYKTPKLKKEPQQ